MRVVVVVRACTRPGGALSAAGLARVAAAAGALAELDGGVPERQAQLRGQRRVVVVEVGDQGAQARAAHRACLLCASTRCIAVWTRPRAADRGAGACAPRPACDRAGRAAGDEPRRYDITAEAVAAGRQGTSPGATTSRRRPWQAVAATGRQGASAGPTVGPNGYIRSGPGVRRRRRALTPTLSQRARE